MSKRVFSVLCMVSMLLFVVSCGSGTSTNGSTLTMTMSESNSQVLTSMSAGKAGKSKMFPATKATDYSAYTIKCVSGAGTAYTGTMSASGSDWVANVTGIPTGTPVVCYLLDGSGNTVTQLTSTDASLLGGQYDAPKLSANSSTTVVYNPLARGAVVTPDANAAPSVTSTNNADPTGLYSMTCVGAFDEITGVENAAYTTTSCASFVAQGNAYVYLHKIEGTQSGSTVNGVGAWRNQDAFTKCGSTESLDHLPTNFSVTTAGQTGAFDWDPSFSGFSSTSTTDQIAAMIVAFGNDATNAAALGQSYAAFAAGSECSWMTQIPLDADKIKRLCSIMYYWSKINSYIQAHPGYACVPVISADWTQTGGVPDATISAKATLASTTMPLNRYDFMPLQFLNDASGNPIGRMSSKQFWTYDAFNQNTNLPVDCIKSDFLLVQFTMPSATPVAGDIITASFDSATSVSDAGGTEAGTALCESSGGSGGEFAPEGYVLRVTMTKQ